MYSEPCWAGTKLKMKQTIIQLPSGARMAKGLRLLLGSNVEKKTGMDKEVKKDVITIF